YKATIQKKYPRHFRKKSAVKKKVPQMHFQRMNFVLVCPPVEKKIVAQRSVQRFCVALERNI
ncbi:MAG: hypothetical protein WA672_15610, partial [Candidatus Angelobacter sp.]